MIYACIISNFLSPLYLISYHLDVQVEERKKSFYGVDWPRDIDEQPDKLVKAGLYYVGPGDRVKCAFCGGKLKNWLPKDSAIKEHIRHFPDCSLVQIISKRKADNTDDGEASVVSGATGYSGATGSSGATGYFGATVQSADSGEGSLESPSHAATS
jgi:hypothetical protein